MPSYLASKLSCCFYKYIANQLARYLSLWVTGYLGTLALQLDADVLCVATLNKILPILLAFDFREQQIICKPRYMKCFQTIFSNTFFPPRLMLLSLASLDSYLASQLASLGFMFTYRKNKLFYVEFSSLSFSSYVKSLINCYIPSYMSQCLLVPDLAQLLATSFLIHHPVVLVVLHQCPLRYSPQHKSC